MELSAILREAGATADGAGTASSETDGEGDDCASPDPDTDLDESLDSHFNYIQQVSAPQELGSLLPRIQESLFQLTDVALVKQLAARRAAEAGAGPCSAADQLRMLARLCFGRSVAACFMLPLMDLGVRTKLNIIGRHLFLQEKFSKLRQPAAPAARLRLPPRLTAAAVESFLSCDHLVTRGCELLVEQAMAAADRVLGTTPLDAPVTPDQLAGLLQSMAASLGHAATASAALTSPCGGASAWLDVLLPPPSAAAVSPSPEGGALLQPGAAAGSAEAYRRALASAAMVEELTAELRRVLADHRFGEALHAAVGQCLSTCAAHLHATFIAQAAQQQQQLQQPQGKTPEVSQPQPPAPEAAPADTLDQQPATEERPAEPQAPAPRAEPPAQQRLPSPFSTAASSPELLSSDAAGEALPSTSAPEAQESASGSEAQAISAASDEGPAAATPARSSSPASSGCDRQSSLAAAAVAAMQPRPLARCLRPVQGACEPLFLDTREVTARIATLPSVMSLCAVAFAAPLE